MKDSMSFVALDFETANSDYSSICQIGLVHFEKGEIVSELSYLIDPQTHFNSMNISVHGIKPEDVIGKPTFCEIYPIFIGLINNRIVVHHQPFDYIALKQACEKFNLEFPNSNWIDNADVVKRTWTQFSVKGYGLKNVANYLNIEFNHHDACEDARAAGLIFIAANLSQGQNIDLTKSIERKKSKYGTFDGHQKICGDVLKPSKCSIDNLFNCKKVVISGTYKAWPDRNDLALIIKELGADIDSSVTDRTNILCAGVGVGPLKVKKMQVNYEAGRDAMIIDESLIIKILEECNVCIPDIQ